LTGEKLVKVERGKQINFDVKARMEEKERMSGRITVGFALSVGTKPAVVKFEVGGTAVLEGKDEDIKQMLEPDPDTQIPLLFQSVYQQSFMSMYLLATLIECPYPPPNLLRSNQEVNPTFEMGMSAPTAESEMDEPIEQAAVSPIDGSDKAAQVNVVQEKNAASVEEQPSPEQANMGVRDDSP
jgi:hypothetical protein